MLGQGEDDDLGGCSGAVEVRGRQRGSWSRRSSRD